MTKYITQERAKYWPITPELMAQYNDGSHTKINIYGTLAWYQNGKLHRDGDKPARIYADGSLEWCQNGKRHRACGPAVIYSDGKLEWWINDEKITQEVNAWLNRKRWRGTPEQIFEFKLRFL